MFLQSVYFTSLVPYDTTDEDKQDTGRAEEEEEENAVKTQEGGVTEESCSQSDGGTGNDHEKEREEEEGGGGRAESPTLQFETYKEAVKKCYLHHTDYNMVGAHRWPSYQLVHRDP